ncbi:MAG: hypothetical protein R6X02_19010 [Enhygromyxa sp.]
MKHAPLAPFLALMLAACRPGQPCPDCDEEAAEEQLEDLPDEDLPDLPCGGADLQTDNKNCGECGNICLVQAPDTDYEAGSCVAGECGPIWRGFEWTEPSVLTCDEVCATATGGALSCQANACSGLTAFVCEVIFGQPCQIFAGGGGSALVDFAGECDEPIPWPAEVQFDGSRHLNCCCG